MLLPAILLLIGSNLTKAQNPTGPTVTNVIPPSPEAQTFMRYGEIPVDPSTGVPNIEIPLYQIKSGKLSLPISLTYHSSGVRVEDIASVAGLGWRLSAGGVLTKTVVGQPDNSPSYGMFSYPYLSKSQIDALPLDGSQFFSLNRITKGIMDSESDRYFYSCGNGLTGQFFYDPSFNIVSATYTDSKIIPLSPASDGSGPTGYEVIDEAGTQYFYQDVEYSKINMDPQYISSWWLTKIVSADGADVIAFEYQRYSANQLVYSQSQSILAYYPGQPSPTVDFTGTEVGTNPLLLKKITFSNGYITFDYVNDRKDLQDNRLSAVSIYSNGSNTPIKQYQLSHSYFYSGVADNKYNYRMKLDRVAVYDNISSNIQNYTFEYDQQHVMPPYLQDLNYNNPACYAQDYSGYFNGIYTNNHLLTGYLPYPNVAADRDPDYNFAKTCVLTKINYPTGGSSSFEYQLNDGPAIASSYQAGLRIHRIVSKTDANTISLIKRYEYGSNLLNIDMDRSGTTQYEWDAQINAANCTTVPWHFTTYASNPIVPFLNFNGSAALYGTVDEYDDDPISNVNLKKTYGYTADGAIIVAVPSIKYLNQYYKDCAWNRGQLNSLTYYKYNPSTGYIPTKSTLNHYTDYRVSTAIAGTKVERILPLVGSGCIVDEYGQPGVPYSSYFNYFDVPILVGARKLTQVTNYTYDATGTISTTSIENTSYNSPDHLFPTSKTMTQSNGDTRTTVIKYPNDFSGTAVYDQMATKNQRNPVIEQKSYKNSGGVSTFLEGTKTDYGFWDGSAWSSTPTNIIVPQTIQTQLGTGIYEPRIQFSAYNTQGNITDQSKAGGPRISYQWGYNKAYPIAQATNTPVNDIFYDGFEEGSGNSGLNDSKTGHYSYSGTYSKSLSGLDPGNYTLSYWLKSGGTWTWQTSLVAVGGSTYSIAISGQIDDVRFYPGNAQMTTYTYDPLIGMTSSTDPKGTVSYYEYDSFNRLMNVKDKDGNILKHTEYHYQGQ